jgi:hypothetical protein
MAKNIGAVLTPAIKGELCALGLCSHLQPPTPETADTWHPIEAAGGKQDGVLHPVCSLGVGGGLSNLHGAGHTVCARCTTLNVNSYCSRFPAWVGKRFVL